MSPASTTRSVAVALTPWYLAVIVASPPSPAKLRLPAFTEPMSARFDDHIASALTSTGEAWSMVASAVSVASSAPTPSTYTASIAAGSISSVTDALCPPVFDWPPVPLPPPPSVRLSLHEQPVEARQRARAADAAIRALAMARR